MNTKDLLGILLLIMPVFVQARSQNFLDALQRATVSHPLSQSIAREVDGSSSDLDAARWQRYPTPSVESLTPKDSKQYTSVNRLVVEQPLFAGGRIDAGIAAAEARRDATKGLYRQTLQDMALRLTNTWFLWQSNRARQVILQDSVEAHRRLKEQIERRASEGVNPGADLTLAVARLSQTRSELAQMQSATRNAYTQLVQLAGDQLPYFTSKADAYWTDVEKLPEPPVQWRAMALERDPQMGKLQSEIDASTSDIRVKKGTLYPSVSLRYEHDYSGTGRGSRVYLQLQSQPGAGLSAISNINSAVARRDTAVEQRANARTELEEQLDINFADYASARERMEVATMLRQSTRDVAESYSRQFVAGRKSWLDVLNAVREAVSARVSIVDAQAQLGQSWWQLRIRALGIEQVNGDVK